MKELSIEQKAKAYDKVSKEVKDFFEGRQKMYSDVNQTLEYLFPELKESEDERIRKALIYHFRGDGCICTNEYRIDYKDICAWLEKQGEQKEYTFKSIPRLLDMIEPSNKAKAYCQKLIDTLTNEGYNADAKIVGEVLKGWNGEDVPMAVMDEQKPSWSEEDENVLEDIEEAIINYWNGDTQDILLDWLKSLKERLNN